MPLIVSGATKNTTAQDIANLAPGGGGGFGAKLMFPEDTPPGSPTTWDDEFPGSSLNGRWTATNYRVGTTPVYNVAGGFLTIENQSIGGGRTLSGITQAVPGGSLWEFTTCVVANSAPLVNYSLPASIAIMAGLGPTDNMLQFGEVIGSSVAVVLGLNSCTWSAYTGPLGNTALTPSRHYLRVHWDGTDLTWSFSRDGVYYVVLYVGTPGFTPAYVGLLADAESSLFTCSGTFAWFRRTV